MKTLIAIPCMSMVHTMFMASLIQLKIEGDVQFSMTDSSLIYDARNRLGQKAVEEGFDRVLWLDSDMTFEPDIFLKLSKWLDEGYDFVSGLYFKRRQPIEPVIYSAIGTKQKDGEALPFSDWYDNYPEGIFEIAGCGFGCVMMNTNVIKEVAEKYGLPFSPILGFGEDLSFCCRASQAGFKMYCDSNIKLGHLGNYTFTENDFKGAS